MLRCSPGANQSAGSISRDHLKANRNALFVSRDLQTAELNRVVRKQPLSSTELITVWRLELSHVIVYSPVWSHMRKLPLTRDLHIPSQFTWGPQAIMFINIIAE